VLFQDRTATQRAQETGTHPDTVGTLKRRFDAQGMLGLVPETLEVVPAGRRRRVPAEVVHELQRLKGLYEGFGARELARIIFHTLAHRIHHHTVQELWQELPPAAPQQLRLLDYHSHAERSQARMEVIALYAQGWSKRSISQFLQVSRPTINTWIARFEADNLESVEDKSRAPHTTVRKVWLPVMVEIYHDKSAILMPAAFASGVCGARVISRCARSSGSWPSTDGSIRTSQARSCTAPRKPRRSPSLQARAAHEYWFIDGRMMDFALEGHRWWSLIILDGYSRTMLAGAVALGSQLGGADVLYTACRRYGCQSTSFRTAAAPSSPRPLKGSVRVWALTTTRL
jgi:hypothetical protein